MNPEEALTALSRSAATNPLAQLAMERPQDSKNLFLLRTCAQARRFPKTGRERDALHGRRP